MMTKIEYKRKTKMIYFSVSYVVCAVALMMTTMYIEILQSRKA